ncbi:DedA family protein [Leifsonia sp. YAF41]|uniref:DedA family protein n=1 Tax=Leifsonia sp. YAF41 TaxID=3233086 RepID=UPI003F974B32
MSGILIGSMSNMSSGILDPQALINGAGAWGLAVVCLIVFAETALLVGFFLPGDTLLFFAGVLTLTGALPAPLWLVIVAVSVAAVLGDQVGYLIGRRAGPAIFNRKESGLFSRASVAKTESYFRRFGSATVIVARFVPMVRTFTPVIAGVGSMRYRSFITFNVIGGVAWSSAAILLGFGLGHVPGVAEFTARYLDLILLGVILVSTVPVLVRSLVLRRRSRLRPANAR